MAKFRKRRKKGKGSFKKLRRTTKKALSKAAVDRAQSRAILANKRFIDSLKPQVKQAGQTIGMTATSPTVVATLNGQGTTQSHIFHELINVGHAVNTRVSPQIKPFHFQLNLQILNGSATTEHGIHVTLAMVKKQSFSVATNFTYRSHGMYYDYNVSTQSNVDRLQLLPKYRPQNDGADTAGQNKLNIHKILYNKYHMLGTLADGQGTGSHRRVLKFNVKLRGKWTWPALATASEELVEGWIPVLFLVSESTDIKQAYRARIYWTE